MKSTREEMASALISLGYEIDRNWQFKLRDENTPSAKINMDGSVHDFGSGWHGDLISLLLEYRDYKDFKSAKEEAFRLLELEVQVDFTKFDKSRGELDERPLPDNFMISHRIDRKNNFQYFLKELKQLFLGEYNGEHLLAAEWEKVLEVSKKYDIGFNKKSGRLIMPIRDTDNKIHTFWKYKKNGKSFKREDGKVIKHKKVLYTKNRPRPPFAVMDLIEFTKTPDETVLITEGEKDALVALANGQRAICIGGTGASKKLNEKYLHLFKNLKVIIAGDYDEAGDKFNKNLKEQLKPIAKSVVILDWEAKAKKDGFRLHRKFDLADYFAWKNMPKTKKVILTIQRTETVNVEVELEENKNVEDLDLVSYFKDGEIIKSETILYDFEEK